MLSGFLAIDVSPCVLRLESTDNSFTVRFSTPEERAVFRQALHNVARDLGVSYYKGDGGGSVLVSPGRRASALTTPPVDHSALTALQLEHLLDVEPEASPSRISTHLRPSESIHFVIQTASSMTVTGGLRDLFRCHLLSVRRRIANCETCSNEVKLCVILSRWLRRFVPACPSIVLVASNVCW